MVHISEGPNHYANKPPLRNAKFPPYLVDECICQSLSHARYTSCDYLSASPCFVEQNLVADMLSVVRCLLLLYILWGLGGEVRWETNDIQRKL